MEEWNLIQENRLKAALSDLEAHFAEYWAAAFEARQEGTIALVAPASYCIQLDGTRLVIDPIFRFPWQQEAVKDRWQRDLAAADGVLYTHSHGDHYRPEIARAALDGGAQVWLPDFLPQAGEEGFRTVKEGETFNIGRLRITSYKSAHFSPDGKSGVPSFGYIIESSRGTMLFPCDVRDYDPAKLPKMHADTVFAHVWLGRGNALNWPCEPYLSDFARFVLLSGPSRIYLAHLYEVGRVPKELWTYAHAGLCMDAIAAQDPTVELDFMRPGRVYPIFG